MAADIVFLSAICYFSDTLKELSITFHPSNVLLSQLICNLPHLTHLTVLFDPLSTWLSPSMEADPGFTDRTCNLVYLHLDSVLSINSRIIPILRRCPKLTTLHLSHDVRKQVFVPTSFDMIFELCQHLRHFAWDVTEFKRVSRMKALSQDEGDGGIRDFVFRGSVIDINKTVSILTKSQLVLERLELSNERYTTAGEWNALTLLDFPRLESLHLGKLSIPPNEWAPFFAHRPNLESLSHLLKYTDGPFIDDLVKAISSLKNLEDLMLLRQVSLAEGRQSEVWSNAWILSRNTNLQRLTLAYEHLSDAVLLDLCTIRSLKEWSLHQNPVRDYKITSKGLCAFAKQLADSDSGIYFLRFEDVKNMDDPVLELLAHVKTLSVLTLSGIDKIINTGVKLFVQGLWTDQ